MPQQPPTVSNPKMRITGLVLVVLGVLAWIGTITGWDAPGTGQKVTFGILGTLMILAGIALLRTRMSAVSRLAADDHGLTVGLRGRAPVVVPWDAVEEVWLRRLSPVFGGYLLFLQLATPQPAALRAALTPFETVDENGATVLGFGLDREQSAAMLAQLPAAGTRFRGVAGREAFGR